MTAILPSAVPALCAANRIGIVGNATCLSCGTVVGVQMHAGLGLAPCPECSEFALLLRPQREIIWRVKAAKEDV